MKKAIKEQGRNFAAIIGLILIAVIVSGYIFSQQRLALPGFVPLIGKKFFMVNAEFSTAQAVTPGQGQTVNIAGVKVGEIQQVSLVNGRADVQMKIQPKYSRIYKDASMLLRPKTGLKDMAVELTPGNPSAGRIPDGYTIPIKNTLPDVNFDEVLATLDGDSRDYLKLLLSGAGEGLRDNGRNVSGTFKTFEPLSRDVAKITTKLATRRTNIRRVVHNFSLVSRELGSKDDEIAKLVSTSNAVFKSFNDQDANLRQTISQLPGTLDDTKSGLGKVKTLADNLGPTLQSLRPGARSLAPALRDSRALFKEATPEIRDHIRPFTRASLPLVRQLRPAANDLAALTPNLLRVFSVANRLLNELSFNPPGDREEGYLFWFSWASHDGNALFDTQDAHGPIRRGLTLASCGSLGALNAVGSVSPQFSVLNTLLNLPSTQQSCPKETAPGQGTGTGQGSAASASARKSPAGKASASKSTPAPATPPATSSAP